MYKEKQLKNQKDKIKTRHLYKEKQLKNKKRKNNKVDISFIL